MIHGIPFNPQKLFPFIKRPVKIFANHNDPQSPSFSAGIKHTATMTITTKTTVYLLSIAVSTNNNNFSLITVTGLPSLRDFMKSNSPYKHPQKQDFLETITFQINFGQKRRFPACRKANLECITKVTKIFFPFFYSSNHNKKTIHFTRAINLQLEKESKQKCISLNCSSTKPQLSRTISKRRFCLKYIL